MYNRKEIPSYSYGDNLLLKKAYDNIERLRDIYDNKVSYISDDYVTLISTFERFYKGYLLELSKTFPDKIQVKEEDFQGSHRFGSLIQDIHKIMPVTPTREGLEAILNRSVLLGNRYTKARFTVDYDIEEFRKDFRRLEGQMSRLMNNLIEEQTKIKNEALDEDLEYW